MILCESDLMTEGNLIFKSIFDDLVVAKRHF